MITGDSRPEDVLTSMNDAILRHASTESIKNKKKRARGKVKPVLDGLERFGGVIDILASTLLGLCGVL